MEAVGLSSDSILTKPRGIAPISSNTDQTTIGRRLGAPQETDTGSAPKPSDLAQVGTVNKSKVEGADRLIASAISEPERILKPYGVTMLPDGPVQTSSMPEDTAA